MISFTFLDQLDARVPLLESVVPNLFALYLAVEGDIVGELVDLERDGESMFSLAIYVEDTSGFTALTVHLEGLSEVLKESMIVGSRVRIVGTLQVLGTSHVVYVCRDS